jgi:inorganic pyrophosphatase
LTLKDLENHYPCRLHAIKKWFKYFKIPQGMKANTIHFDEKILGPEKAFEVINESYLSWKELKEVVKLYHM